MDAALQDLEAVVQEARRVGARGAEVLRTTWVQVGVRAAGRGSPRRERDEGSRLTVRCWLEGGRRGEAVGAPSEVPALLDAALTLAARSPEDPFSGPIRRTDLPPRGLGVDDQRRHQLTDADRADVVTANLRAATRRPEVLAGACWYRERREVRQYVNHHGVALELPHTTYEAGGEVEAQAGDDRLLLRDHIAGRAFASIACLPFGASLAQRVAALSGASAPLSGPVRVLLPPRATGRLVAWLGELFAADRLDPGENFVARGASEQLFHRRLHLVDDGALPGGLHTRGFDDRGVAPVPLTLVREGRVAARLLTPEDARRLGSRPTGHCGSFGLRPTNLQLNSGSRSMNAWLGEQDVPVFEVDDLPDLSGICPRTGDLEVVVNGLVYDRQTVRGARRGARLRGNLVEALRQVVAITSDTDRVLHVDAPGMLLDGLSLDA